MPTLLLERPAGTSPPSVLMADDTSRDPDRDADRDPDRDADRDARLARAFFDGDEAALAEAYNRHGRLVHTLAARAVGADRAADVTQETFIAAWRSRANFDPDRSLRAWLLGIARFKAIDATRVMARTPVPSGDDGPESMAAADVERVGEQLLVADALDELPERSRQLIELAFFHDLTHQQISDQQGIPLGTVKSDIRRGLTKLRRHLAAYQREGNGDGSRR